MWLVVIALQWLIRIRSPWVFAPAVMVVSHPVTSDTRPLSPCLRACWAGDIALTSQGFFGGLGL